MNKINDPAWNETILKLRIWILKQERMSVAAEKLGVSVPTLRKLMRGQRMAFFTEMKIMNWVEAQNDSTR